MDIMSKYHAWKLNRMQKTVDKRIDSEGFNDEILDKQLEINKKRNKLNIPDPKTLNDDGWAQQIIYSRTN